MSDKIRRSSPKGGARPAYRSGPRSTGTGPQLRSLSVIYELTKAIISLHDFDELLAKISEETTKIFNATLCLIRLVEGGKLKLRASFGVPETLRDTLGQNMGEGVAGRVAAEGKTLMFKSPGELSPLSFLAQHLPVQTAICTPLKIGEQIIGTFGLYDKRAPGGSVVPFTDDDAVTLEGFASIAAIVIDKSILYENALRQEREALEAKRRVEELKDYLEGLIENSADAIVTTDLNGIVTSWNEGAEKIYGFTRKEAVGNFLPFIPNFFIDTERGYIERVKRGETIKDIETVRTTRDGGMIDVNLTLSPIKDSSGEVIGTTGITRDITEKKRTEKDLLRRNAELSRLFFISSAMRGTLELDKLLRMVLTAVTVGNGLGFNRAMLFLVDEDRKVLKGALGVGPASHEEAWEIWSRLSTEHKDIHAIIEDIERGPSQKDSLIDRLCRSIEIPLEQDYILTRSVKEKRPFNISDVRFEPLVNLNLVQQLGTHAYAVVPLISRGRVIGVLWVDNVFSGRPITDHDMDFLKGFTDQMASAVENARLFEHCARAEQELENIFESISDMVFFNSSDYTIGKINRAVVDKIGKPAEEIIGKKCFEIFHGLHEPWKKCPHHKTVMTRKPFIEELEDPHLGGTFLVSSSPIFDKAGTLLGTVHVTRDIGELKKLRERIASTERMAALGEMAAKVAHEIRNPLLSIGGFARRLEKRLESDLKEYAKIIVTEVTRLEGILNDTLNYVRSAKLEKREVDADEIIDNVINLLEPAAHDRGNVLVKEISRPLKLYVDFDRLKQALLNIMTNAIQATERGRVVIRAQGSTVLSESDVAGRLVERGEALIEIEDCGCGIREEDMDRLFDPFFTTRPAGTGLGLSITKRIIGEHGGRIEVESVLGRGTVFRIHLPLKED